MQPQPIPSWYFTSSFIAHDGSIAGSYADAAVLELLGGGAERLTMAAIARQLNCTPSAIHQMSGGRVEFLRSVARSFATRYRNWLRVAPGTGWARLPIGDDEIHAVRCWLALSELAAAEARAGRPACLEIVDQTDDSEADTLAWRLNVTTESVRWEAVDGTLAAVRGIRAAMAAENPLGIDQALPILQVLRSQLTNESVR